MRSIGAATLRSTSLDKVSVFGRSPGGARWRRRAAKPRRRLGPGCTDHSRWLPPGAAKAVVKNPGEHQSHDGGAVVMIVRPNLRRGSLVAASAAEACFLAGGAVPASASGASGTLHLGSYYGGTQAACPSTVASSSGVGPHAFLSEPFPAVGSAEGRLHVREPTSATLRHGGAPPFRKTTECSSCLRSSRGTSSYAAQRDSVPHLQ
jgi:hypothetical protein